MTDLISPSAYTQDYLNYEMKEELFLSLAKKEARRIVKQQNFRKTSIMVENHIKVKYRLAGS